jgi:DNA-binding XRE family transcriptional regulator
MRHYVMQRLRNFMSRPSRCPNNPIQQLRRILAAPGNKELSQAELAPIIDINRHSLNSIECDRMKLSRRMLNQIRLSTGAFWHPVDNVWRFWYEGGPTYTHAHYQRYVELKTKDPIGWPEGSLLQFDIFFATARIRLLLETLPRRNRLKFLFRLNTFLSESREEFCPNNFAEFFADAQSLVLARPELDRDHPMNVQRVYLPRVIERAPNLKTLEEWLKKIRFDLAGYEKEISQRPQWGLPRVKKKRRTSSRGG